MASWESGESNESANRKYLVRLRVGRLFANFLRAAATFLPQQGPVLVGHVEVALAESPVVDPGVVEGDE